MKTIIQLYKKLERTVGSMKFAVVIISLYTIALIYGTFMESYHGADFANRLVYKSWPFILIQLAMFLSILMAALIRLPAKKRLYGFYTIHSGLIILFIGSFITYINGVDGTIQLIPNAPTNKIVLNEDLLRIEYPQENKAITYKLPYGAFEQQINSDYKNIKLLTYYPSAKNKNQWVESPDQNLFSATYQIFNDNISQDFTLSLFDQSDFKSTTKLGPLNIHLMPTGLADCFKLNSTSGLLVYNSITQKCFTPESRKLSIEKTDQGTQFFVMPHKGKWLKFFPQVAPVPINDDLSRDTDSPFRVFGRELFTQSPHLFLFGNKLAYYKKRKNKWIVEAFASQPIALPWMGFQVRQINFKPGQYPQKVPQYTRPIHDSGNIVEGMMQALQIEVGGQKFWVTTDNPLILSDGENKVRVKLTKKELLLPYELTLENFKMDTNPGTNDPASYESFVTLLDGRSEQGAIKNHVYMNNPLKYDGFTFYQASYFQMQPGVYGSVLSVNFDPGRPIKYFGSLLIVLGSIWHYFIRRKKTKVSKANTKNFTLLGEQNA